MTILVIKPMEAPKVKEIDSSLESMQKEVGGYIQAIYPFEDSVALICNEGGKLFGFPLNRALRDENGEIYDIVCGTFFLCSAQSDEENFSSLTDEQIERFSKLYQQPEFFL